MSKWIPITAVLFYFLIAAYGRIRTLENDKEILFESIQQVAAERDMARQQLRHSQWETEVKTLEATQAINELHALKMGN